MNIRKIFPLSVIVMWTICYVTSAFALEWRSGYVYELTVGTMEGVQGNNFSVVLDEGDGVTKRYYPESYSLLGTHSGSALLTFLLYAKTTHNKVWLSDHSGNIGRNWFDEVYFGHEYLQESGLMKIVMVICGLFLATPVVLAEQCAGGYVYELTTGKVQGQSAHYKVILAVGGSIHRTYTPESYSFLDKKSGYALLSFLLYAKTTQNKVWLYDHAGKCGENKFDEVYLGRD